MRNNRLVELQRATIEQLEEEIKMLKKENELLKSKNERLEQDVENVKGSFQEAMEEYFSMMEGIKEVGSQARELFKSTALEKKESEKQFNSLMKEVNKSRKKIPLLCSSCGEKLTEDYVFKNGCYICIHCWDGGDV